uniref:Uncharacterized protein n=1 Tax=Tetranychus urticae TaxID=32264 RepID=T1JRU3_TETUR
MTDWLRKWSHLIAERTRKVEYLVENRHWRHDETSPSNTFGYVYYRTEEPIDGNCLSTLFPNLMIADFYYGLCIKGKHEDIVTLIKKMPSLEGNSHEFYNTEQSIFQHCDQLEMVSTNYVDPCMEKNGVSIKQLHLWNCTLNRFKEDAHYFPNLERLSISNNEGNI